jgi:hypothetical protein
MLKHVAVTFVTTAVVVAVIFRVAPIRNFVIGTPAAA